MKAINSGKIYGKEKEMLFWHPFFFFGWSFGSLLEEMGYRVESQRFTENATN